MCRIVSLCVPETWAEHPGMTVISNPSVRSRQVASLLRRLREEAGLTGAAAAAALGMSASKISRLETGNRGLYVDDVAALLGLYRVPEREREVILAQVKKSNERGWWESQGLPPPSLVGLLDLGEDHLAVALRDPVQAQERGH